MDPERPKGPPAADDNADVTHVRIDPRFDDATRAGARPVVPLAENVRVSQPSPAARQVTRLRALVIILFLCVVALVAALVWALNARYGTTPVTPITPPPPTMIPTSLPSPSQSPSPSVSPSASPSPSVSPSVAPGASPSATATPAPFPSTTPTLSPPARPAQSPPQSPQSNANSNSNDHAIPNLLIPVAGVRPDQLRNTYDDARSEGRVHNAIDIMAAKGTPVLAAADGTIVKLFQSVKGGTTLYVRGADDHTVYYYAHLDRYADGIAEGRQVRRGDVIAYVGDTGDAGPGNYHLHFEIGVTDDPKRWYGARPLNPYPLLSGKR